MGGTQFHSTESQGCACVYSFHMGVRERDFPAQLEESGGVLLVSSGAQLRGLCSQARDVLWGGLLEPKAHLLLLPVSSGGVEGTPHSKQLH